MVNQPSLRGVGAAMIVSVGAISAGVITLGFIIPDRLFESTVGLVAFFTAVLLMLPCAVIANLYDLRGILRNEFA